MAYIGNKPPIVSNLITDIKIGEDDQTKIDFETADEIHFYANNVEQVYLGDNIFGPQSDSDVDLGSSSVRWKDAYVDSVTSTGAITAGGILKTDDTTNATSTTDGSLQTDGGLSVVLDAIFGDDVSLLSDSAVLNMGAGNDVTFTHDGTTGLTIAANPFEVDSGGNIILDAHTGIFIFQDANSEVLRITESGSGDVTIKLETNAKDLIFTDNGDAEGFRILDAAAGVKVAGTLDLGHASDTTLARSATAEVTIAGTLIKKVGTENMWVPATAMTPSETNGCASITVVESGTNKPDFSVLDFDPSSDEFAQFSIAFPKSWNEGTITFQPYWTVTGTNTGTVAWELSGFSYDSDDAMSAFTGSVTTTALAHSGTSNDLMISVVSGNITIQGSPAAEDLCFFRINRDVSADNQSGDARLIGIKIIYTTDTSTDA